MDYFLNKDLQPETFKLKRDLPQKNTERVVQNRFVQRI